MLAGMTYPISPGRFPAGTTPEGDAVVIGDGLIRVDAFIDFLCQEFDACLSDAPYLDWPPFVTARATAAGVGATPTVLVAGEVVAPEAEAITAAVARADGAR